MTLKTPGHLTTACLDPRSVQPDLRCKTSAARQENTSHEGPTLAAGSPSLERLCHQAHPVHATVPPAWEKGLCWPFLRHICDLASACWLRTISPASGLAPGSAAVHSIAPCTPTAWDPLSLRVCNSLGHALSCHHWSAGQTMQ